MFPSHSTKCRAPIRARKCWANSMLCKLQRLAFPWLLANPTMPIGPHNGNLTPPTLMLQYFLSRRVQIYLDFTMNLVDVRDVAMGLLLAMEHEQTGQRYILGGENIALKK